jgi:cyclophilin family peptidyl-prolyl cis-trans isomerase
MMKKQRMKQLRMEENRRTRQKRVRITIGILFLVILLGVYFYSRPNILGVNSPTSRPNTTTRSTSNRIAVIETSMGTMEFELFEDKAPITTGHFIDLAQRGFYNGLIFHRVVKGFVIQGGDPTGIGTGGSGKAIPDEIVPELKHDSIGVLSMANAGPNTGDSQFFITLAPAPHLDGKHSIFGKLIRGQDVLLAIGSVAVGAGDRPLTDITMKITIK